MTHPEPKTLPAFPEGRPGMYLVIPADVIDWLDGKAAATDEQVWHCLIPTGPMMLGADWSHIAVLDLLRKPGVRVAVNLDRDDCWLHQLAVADDAERRLTVFDVGEIRLDDLAVA